MRRTVFGHALRVLRTQRDHVIHLLSVEHTAGLQRLRVLDQVGHLPPRQQFAQLRHLRWP